MGPAQFGGKAGAAEPPIVAWQAARVGAKLIPLTQGELIIDRVRLEGPRFHLIKRADGTSNWDDVIASIKARSKPPPSTGPDLTPGPRIGGFEVRDGTLEYTDRAKGTHLAITAWKLNVGEWRAGATFPVETEFAYQVEKPGAADARSAAIRTPAAGGRSARAVTTPPWAAHVEASARVHISDDANDIDLFGLESSNRLTGGPLPAQGLPVTFQVSRLAARLSPLDIAISEVTGRIGDARVTASIQAGETGPDKTPYVRGPVAVQVSSVRNFLPQLGVKKAPLPLDKGTIGPLKLTSMWEWNDGAIAVNSIDFTLDETHFNGDLMRGRGDDPVWTFTLHGDKIGLSRYVAVEETSKEPFELPLAMLRALKVQGELTFDQAWMADAQMKNVRLRLELADGAMKKTSQ
jgi:AsmA protein